MNLQLQFFFCIDFQIGFTLIQFYNNQQWYFIAIDLTSLQGVLLAPVILPLFVCVCVCG